MGDKSTAGFIGLGVMGEPMCRNMVGKGPGRVVVHDVDPGPVGRLVDDGAAAAASVAEVAAAADVVFLSLPGGPEVEAVVLGPGGLLEAGRSGQCVVDMSTAPVALARRAAAALKAKGISFADAPVARTRQAAIDGTLSIMVGAAPDVFERIRPWLATAATDVTHCGGVGAGQTVKLLNNMLLAQSVVAIAEALTIGARAGVAPEVLAEALSKGSADSFALRNHGFKAMLPGEFPVGAFSARYMRKDLSYGLELAADCGVAAPAAELADGLLERAVAAGYAEEYFPVVIKLIEAMGKDG